MKPCSMRLICNWPRFGLRPRVRSIARRVCACVAQAFQIRVVRGCHGGVACPRAVRCDNTAGLLPCRPPLLPHYQVSDFRRPEKGVMSCHVDPVPSPSFDQSVQKPVPNSDTAAYAMRFKNFAVEKSTSHVIHPCQFFTNTKCRRRRSRGRRRESKQRRSVSRRGGTEPPLRRHSEIPARTVEELAANRRSHWAATRAG